MRQLGKAVWEEVIFELTLRVGRILQVKFIESPGNEPEPKADHGRVEDPPPCHVLTLFPCL